MKRGRQPNEQVLQNGAEKPHGIWKARAKNRAGVRRPRMTLMQLLENDLRFSTPHPYWRVIEMDRLMKQRRLEILAEVVDLLREEA